jgi:tRNA(Ile)-lysidine synthase
MTLLQLVRQALLRHGVARGDALAVACSHGPDSLALADLVLELRRPMRLGPVTLLYVHHGLRAEADDEARRVTAFAEARGAAGRVLRITVDRRRGRGLEDAARRARLAALEGAGRELGARFVLLGHTASDQAETVLGRLLRGSGPVGLAAIPPARGLFLRPLLEATRAEVEAWLRRRRLAPSHDASNDSPAFQRNRLRHVLLPALRQENPEAERALARAAAALREVAEALDWAADRALLELAPATSAGEVRLPAARLAALPAGIAKRALQRLAEGLGASLEANHLQALLELARGGRGRALALPRLTARRAKGDVILQVGVVHRSRALTKREGGAINDGQA